VDLRRRRRTIDASQRGVARKRGLATPRTGVVTFV